MTPPNHHHHFFPPVHPPTCHSLYASEPAPPSYEGQYQGWPQFCNGAEGQYGDCAVTGGLCSWENSTGVNFTQVRWRPRMLLPQQLAAAQRPPSPCWSLARLPR